uniref:Uncharacterized protein n=1 Tax=Denticeps clupeoides TaxID=299321 RepID=A0AAY4AD84_9TELE
MLLEPGIWHQQNESMDPSCLVSTVQAGGGGCLMVWGTLSCVLLLTIRIMHHVLMLECDVFLYSKYNTSHSQTFMY